MKHILSFLLGAVSGIGAIFWGLAHWQSFQFLWRAVIDTLVAAGFPITLG